MLALIKKYKNLVILAIVFFFATQLLLSNQQNNRLVNFFEQTITSVLAPFQSLVMLTATSIMDTWDDYFYLVNLKQKNDSLRIHANKLELQNTFLKEAIENFKRTNNLFSQTTFFPHKFYVANVIGREPDSRSKILVLDKGKKHGVMKNMSIVTHKGLAGRVVQVSYLTSKVLLLTDIRSAVDCFVQRTRDRLVVVGTSSGQLEVKYLDVRAKVKSGDKIISSGLGQIFPKGLPVGMLTHVSLPDKNNLFKKAALTSSADLSHIEAVLIVVQPSNKH
jgi:rod shape-determining protein MreC